MHFINSMYNNWEFHWDVVFSNSNGISRSLCSWPSRCGEKEKNVSNCVAECRRVMRREKGKLTTKTYDTLCRGRGNQVMKNYLHLFAFSWNFTVMVHCSLSMCCCAYAQKKNPFLVFSRVFQLFSGQHTMACRLCDDL